MPPPDEPAPFASPPCFLHEVDPAYSGLVPAFDPAQWRDVARWRKATRERLVAARLALSAETRAAHAETMAGALDALIGDAAGTVVSLYWPFRGEPDFRPWMARLTARGVTCALPIVVEKHRPLIFRPWGPQTPLAKGVWNIPIPAEGPEIVPDILIAPVIGFDAGCYRLGYGGGFFDRTLAAATHAPRVFGVGYEMQALATIYPQPHDIPMSAIVTERRVLHPAATTD